MKCLSTIRSLDALRLAALAGWALMAPGASANPVTTAFTYQGELSMLDAPVTGAYDLRFRLYDAAGGNVQVGAELCANDVVVTNGKFTVSLDFGAQFAGQQRFLEIDVRADTGLDCTNTTGFQVLTPRQELTATPNALNAATASNAITLNGQPPTFYTSAPNLTGTLPSASLAGTYSGALTLSNASNVFTGSGAGLTLLNATNISSGTVADARLSTNIPKLNTANAFGAFNNTFAGNVGISMTNPGYPLNFASTLGDKISLNGTIADSPHFGFGIQTSLLQIHTATHTQDIAFGYGTSAAMTEVVRITGDGQVGIGLSNPAYPLNFASVLGDKISLYGTGANHFGFGIQNATLQIHTSASNADIVFGYGNSAALTETVRFKGDGRVGIGISTPDDTMLHTFTNSRAVSATVESNTSGGTALSVLATGTLATVGGSFSSDSTTGTAVYAIANANTGVTYGVSAFTDSNAANAVAVRGECLRNGANFGVYGSALGASGWGVFANGRLGSSGTKSFMIDHPLDPENKYLIHYSAESPDVLNIYTGVADLDGNGEVWITLPDYFAAINIEPRYMLTSVGAPAPMLHIAEEIVGNRFRIAGGAPNAKVSWEVKAKRNDPYVQQFGAPVVREKGEGERGTYLMPRLYGKPAEKGQFHVAARRAPVAAQGSEAVLPGADNQAH